jgi:hypothetical protein
MIEFSEDEGSLLNSPKTIDYSEKEQKRKDLNDYIKEVEYHRKRKIAEEILKLKREA